MNKSALSSGIRVIPQYACLGLASWFAVSFIYVAMMSLTYPFHLEWMEGHMIDTIQRIFDGKNIYVEPSIEFVPFIYTPLFYYVAAAVAWFTGVDFFPARLVSFLSTLGTAGILALWIRREGGQWWHGVVGAGLFLATYKLSGRWFDTSRIDSLYLFVTMCGLYMLFYFRGKKYAVLTACIFAAGFFIKQATVLSLAPALLALLFIHYKDAFRIGFAAAGMLLVGVYIADKITDGWFRYYVFEIPAGHTMDMRYITSFWTHEMLLALPVCFALLPLLLFTVWQQEKAKIALYAGLFGALVVSSYLMRIHYGSYLNVLIPAHACMALFAGLTLAKMQQHPKVNMLLVLAIIGQMGMLVYNPLPLIPTKQSAEEGNRFLAEIAKIEGDIFMPELQWVQTRVGKKSYGYSMAAYDIFRSDVGEKNYYRWRLGKELERAIREKKFAAIMPGRLFKLQEKRGFYEFSRHIPYPQEYVTGLVHFVVSDIFVPVAGESK
jgi:hypothetical protein